MALPWHPNKTGPPVRFQPPGASRRAPLDIDHRTPPGGPRLAAFGRLFRQAPKKGAYLTHGYHDHRPRPDPPVQAPSPQGSLPDLTPLQRALYEAAAPILHAPDV